jgi:hypothetical protein
MMPDKNWTWIPMDSAERGALDEEGEGIWIPMSKVAPGPSEETPAPPPGRRGVWILSARFAAAARRAQIGRPGQGPGIWIPMRRVGHDAELVSEDVIQIRATQSQSSTLGIPMAKLAAAAIWKAE